MLITAGSLEDLGISGTHPVVFALQQVKGAGPLNPGQKPYRMTAYETFQQSNVATGRVPGTGPRGPAARLVIVFVL